MPHPERDILAALLRRLRAGLSALAVQRVVHYAGVLSAGVQRSDRLLDAPGTPGPLPEGLPATGRPGTVAVVVVVHQVVAAVGVVEGVAESGGEEGGLAQRADGVAQGLCETLLKHSTHAGVSLRGHASLAG